MGVMCTNLAIFGAPHCSCGTSPCFMGKSTNFLWLCSIVIFTSPDFYILEIWDIRNSSDFFWFSHLFFWRGKVTRNSLTLKRWMDWSALFWVKTQWGYVRPTVYGCMARPEFSSSLRVYVRLCQNDVSLAPALPHRSLDWLDIMLQPISKELY